MATLNKLLALATLAPANPREFRDRVAAIAEVRADRSRQRQPDYAPRAWPQLVAALRARYGDIDAILAEAALAEVEAETMARLADLGSDAPFARIHSADVTLARCCYGLCRLLIPETVVETGVAYGVTSAFMLRALAENGRGVLHSIDLPPLGKDADRFVGIAASPALRERWRLHRGVSRRVLPGLLAAVGPIDLFVHDSLHTDKTMRWEFATALTRLRPGGAIVADDIDGNAAFADLCGDGMSFCASVREVAKSSVFGVAVR